MDQDWFNQIADPVAPPRSSPRPAGPNALVPLTPPRPPAPQTPAQAALDEQQVTNARLSAQKTAQELAKDARDRELGTLSPGYRFKPDGTAEAIPGGPADPKRKENLDTIADAQAELLNVVKKAQLAKQLAQEGWFTTGFGADAMSGIGGTKARDLKATLDTIKGNVAFAKLQQMRQTSPTGASVGNVSDADMRLLQSTIASLDQGQSAEKFSGSLDDVIGRYSEMYKRLGGDERQLREALGVLPGSDDREGVTVTGAPPAGGNGGGDGSGTPPLPGGRATITTGPVQFATDTDRRYAAVLQSILDRGGTFADAMAVAREYGNAPTGEALAKFRQAWNEALKWNKSNGNFGLGKAKVSIPQSGRRDTTAIEKVVGSIASNPVGASIVGAANGIVPFDDELYGAADSLLTGKPMDQAIAEADFRKGLIRDTNPLAFGAGQVAGGVGTMLATGGVAGVGRGSAALAPRALALDATYGAVFGAGENNQDRAGGAFTGGALGATGGALGRGLTNRIAGAIAPRVDPEIATLRDMGVRMSPGVAAGETVSRAEQKFVSVPGIGDMIRSNRNRAIEDFNKGVVNKALGEIGVELPKDTPAGTQAMSFAQNAFNRAYDAARSQMRLVADEQMFADLAALDRQMANGGLDAGSYERLRKIYQDRVQARLGQGRIDGDRYKSISSSLGKLARGTGASNPELSGAIREMQSILDAAARRSSPPEASAALDAADRGYALFVRAESAAKTRGGETGTFTPRAFDGAVQRGDGSVRSKAYLRGEALGQDLARAGLRLGDTVPNSGTADRLAAMGLAGGAGYLNPASMFALGGVGATQLPGVRGALVSMMTREASPKMQTIGDAIRARAQLTGAVSSPLLLAYDQGN